MAISHILGTAAANVSHFLGTVKANVSAILGSTASFGGGGGGGITFVGAGSFESNAGAVTPTLPLGTQEDDILVAFLLSAAGEAISISGWTAAGNSPQNNGAWGFRGTVLWKRAGSSESNPTTNDSGTINKGIILGFRGCIATGNPFEATSGSVDTGFTASVVVPGVTTLGANRMVVASAAFWRNATSTANVSGGANGNLSDFNERADAATVTGFSGQAVWSGIKAAAGATGNTTATLAESTGYAYWTGALIPA